MAQELKLLRGLIRLAHPMPVRQLQQHWLRAEPDPVVSLVPNFNREMFESLTSALPGVPCVTLLTDLADLPPHFWTERDPPQHFICGHNTALATRLRTLPTAAPHHVIDHCADVPGSFRSVERAVAELLGDLDGFRASVSQVRHRALFEVPRILDRILREAEFVRTPNVPVGPVRQSV